MLQMAYYQPSLSQQNYHHSKTLEIDVGREEGITQFECIHSLPSKAL